MFCFFSMTFLQGLGIWPLILFFTSLLWQLSCKAWHSKKKISMSGWDVLFPWFGKAWDVWRLTSQPSLLALLTMGHTAFCWKMNRKEKKECSHLVLGPVAWMCWIAQYELESLSSSLHRDENVSWGSWFRILGITQTGKQCFVLYNLYHHLLLISSQSWQFHLQIYRSDLHPYQTGLVLGFPTVRCHLGSLASSGRSQINPHLRSSPLANNLQVRFLDANEIGGSIAAFL